MGCAGVSRRVTHLFTCIHADDSFDGAATDGTKLLVTRKHDAVLLRAVVSAGLVVGAFEGTDAIGILVRSQQFVLVLLLFFEESVHLRLRTVLGANFVPLCLDVVLVGLEFRLTPRGG